MMALQKKGQGHEVMAWAFALALILLLIFVLMTIAGCAPVEYLVKCANSRSLGCQ
jgi:hypothetical protein